jgi:hypothetical protein
MAQRAREGSSFGQTTDATPEASAEESSDSVADFVARGFERQVEARAAAAAGAAEAFAAEPKAEDYVKKVRAAMENLAIKEAILAEARQSFVQSGGAAPQPSPEASTALAKAIGAAEAVLATGATAMQASSVVSEILAEVPQMPSNQPTPPAQAKGTPTSPAPAAGSATPASPASSEAPVIADAVPSEEAGSLESSAPGIADVQTPTTVEQSVQTPVSIDQAATTPTATSAETPQAGASPSAQSVPISSAAPIATPDALANPLSELTNAPLANLTDITLATPAISPAATLPASASASGVNELSNVEAQSQTPARATPAARTAAKAATLLDEDEKTRGKGRRRRRRKPGQDFPSRAAWKQGFGYRELDLDTGKSKFTLEPPPGVKIAEGPGSARKSFTVLEFDDDPPSQREIDMGAVLATVGEEIVYRPDHKNRRPKKGRRRGRRPRGRGRKPGSRRQVRF